MQMKMSRDNVELTVAWLRCKKRWNAQPALSVEPGSWAKVDGFTPANAFQHPVEQAAAGYLPDPNPGEQRTLNASRQASA